MTRQHRLGRRRTVWAAALVAVALGAWSLPATAQPARPAAAVKRPAPAAPARCPAVKAFEQHRKLTARLDKCRRRLIHCYEKLDDARQRITFRDVVGGIGWIVGLCGLALATAVLWRQYQERRKG